MSGWNSSIACAEKLQSVDKGHLPAAVDLSIEESLLSSFQDGLVFGCFFTLIRWVLSNLIYSEDARIWLYSNTMARILYSRPA